MRKITFLLLGLMMFTRAGAVDDQYYPLVEEGRKWVYLIYEQVGYSHEITPLFLYSFEIRDELIVYYTLLDNNMSPIGEPTPVAFIVENKSNRGRVARFPISSEYPDITDTEYNLYPFWYKFDSNNGIYNVDIYDFSKEGYLPPLDSHLWSDAISHLRNIDEKTTVMVGGESHNAYILNTMTDDSDDEFFFGCKVIEGIGVDSRSGDLLSPQLFRLSDDFFEEQYPGLVAVYDGDELIYKGCLYNEAMQFAGINTVESSKRVQSVRYFNLAGVESAEPLPGVNIKVTTYSDGTRQSEKVVQ